MVNYTEMFKSDPNLDERGTLAYEIMKGVTNGLSEFWDNRFVKDTHIKRAYYGEDQNALTNHLWALDYFSRNSSTNQDIQIVRDSFRIQSAFKLAQRDKTLYISKPAFEDSERLEGKCDQEDEETQEDIKLPLRINDEGIEFKLF